MIGNLHQEFEAAFLLQFSSKADGGSAQVCGIPAVRFDFIFEKPLHALSMLGGTPVLQRAADLCGDLRRRCRPRRCRASFQTASRDVAFHFAEVEATLKYLSYSHSR